MNNSVHCHLKGVYYVKICEMKQGSEIILDFTADRKLKVILGSIRKGCENEHGKAMLYVTLRKEDYDHLDLFSVAVNVYAPNDGNACVFENVFVTKTDYPCEILLTCETNNVLVSRRKTQRISCSIGGLAFVDKHMPFPVNTKDISSTGVSLYVAKGSELLPGSYFNLNLIQAIPEEVMSIVGCISNKRAVVHRIQDADYGRVLIGAEFIDGV